MTNPTSSYGIGHPSIRCKLLSASGADQSLRERRHRQHKCAAPAQLASMTPGGRQEQPPLLSTEGKVQNRQLHVATFETKGGPGKTRGKNS